MASLDESSAEIFKKKHEGMNQLVEGFEWRKQCAETKDKTLPITMMVAATMASDNKKNAERNFWRKLEQA